MDLNPLFHATEDYVSLVGTTCPACGTTSFPPRSVCPNCLNREQVDTALSTNGQIVRAARVALPPAGFHEPIVIGVVRLDAGPSVFAVIQQSADEPLAPGTPVVAVPAPVRDGQPGFAFRSAA